MSTSAGPSAASAIEPKGRQSDVIYFSPNEDLVVLGTAGTGKSTMAVMRARFLADPDGQNGGPVLLVTYNKALVRYLRHLVPSALGDVTVETYGKFARGYLASQGKMPRANGILQGSQHRRLIQGAIEVVRRETEGRTDFFKRGPEFFIDELAWIAGMGIENKDDYLAVDRIGRKSGLGPNRRKIVWKVRKHYLEARTALGIPYDWNDLPSAVRKTLADDGDPRLYRHVVIDEGQDLSPEAIRSLKEAVQDGGTVSFFGDYHQQIYGQALSYRQCGLNIKAVDEFADNYRNTAEIARVAISMSAMEHMESDPEDLVVPVEPTAGGTTPALVACTSAAAEVAEIRRIAQSQSSAGTVAVLTRTWADAQRVVDGLSARRIKEDADVDWDARPGIYYGTYHSAKGLEFDVVLMPFCSQDDLPLRGVVDGLGIDDARSRDGRLLYVAVTRAKAELIVTYSGEPSDLLPLDADLWQERSA